MHNFNPAAAYAWDWIDIVHRVTAKWKNINICLITPVATSDCHGSFSRDISQLAVWLTQVYRTSTSGILDLWSTVVAHMDSSSSGGILLLELEQVKHAFPSDLAGTSSIPLYFKYNSSCPPC